MPTLRFLFPSSGILKKQQKRPLYDTLAVKLKERNMKNEECLKLLKTTVNFIYPNKPDLLELFEGDVIGFINMANLRSIGHLDYFRDTNYNIEDHTFIFEDMCEDLRMQYQQLVINIISIKHFLSRILKSKILLAYYSSSHPNIITQEITRENYYMTPENF